MGIVLVAAMMVGAVIWGAMMRPSSAPCASIRYMIEDQSERSYVTGQELDQLLRTESVHPVGQAVDRGLLHRIEKTVAHHPMVRTAECYVTPRHEVRVRITQRVPLLRVVKPGDAYFIDTDRRVMQARASVRDSVLMVTGSLGVQMASGQMADYAEWLKDNKYWRVRIHHVAVQSPQMVCLYLKEGQPRVMLGTMHGYEQKLRKLQTFFEQSPQEIREKTYSELDVRFKGQVIGRR